MDNFIINFIKNKYIFNFLYKFFTFKEKTYIIVANFVGGSFMFEKVKLKILKKLLEKAYPGRDFDVQKFGKLFIINSNNHVGCNDFLLKGQYTYDQVMELNKKTGYSAGFGFCKELGPVAFIGVPNPKCVQNSGYFFHEVQAYGQSINEDEYYFKQYTDEDAKAIGNYTVYGMGDPRILKNAAPIEKVVYLKDFRFKCKDEYEESFNPDVLSMEIKLGGTYSFYKARKFAYGSTGEFEGSSGEDVSIQFAIVGGNQPVGILDLRNHYDNAMFRDVWGPNEDEPEKQSIRFLDDDEAEKIQDFKLYYFMPTHSFGKKQFITEKIDRTLCKGFDFIMDDGTDYRLQDIQKEKSKVKTLDNNNKRKREFLG